MIRSFQDLYSKVRKEDLIIVLYSGGLDGTYLLATLIKQGYSNVTALHIDISSADSNDTIKNRLEVLGVNYEILDCTDEFANNYILSAIQAQAKYNGIYPISASLSRPLIVKSTLEFISTNKMKDPVILHTSNASQNSLRRFNNSLKDLRYGGLYGSPYENTHTSRKAKLNYLMDNKIAFDLQLFSEDSNIWCREFEYGDFENIESIKVNENAYLWTEFDENATQENVTITFIKGIPIALNGSKASLTEIITQLRGIAGKYSIGRYLGLEEIHTGQKVLEIRESPAAALLMDAYKMLELATINSETSTVKMNIEQIWVRESSEGRWFGDLHMACESFCKNISGKIGGSVTYKLSKNNYALTSLISDRSNYISDRDDFEENQ